MSITDVLLEGYLEDLEKEFDERYKNEDWKPILGYENRYWINKYGKIFSVLNILYLKPYILNGGYVAVQLRQNGFRKHKLLHRLVLETYKGLPENLNLDCCHLDGNKLNNHIDNLIWATRKENESHKLIHGTRVKGESHGGHKLTKEQVSEIRELYVSKKYTQQEIAKMYSVHQTRISFIVTRKNWT